jgi:hypothetical protein
MAIEDMSNPFNPLLKSVKNVENESVRFLAASLNFYGDNFK